MGEKSTIAIISETIIINNALDERVRIKIAFSELRNIMSNLNEIDKKTNSFM